MSSEGSLIAGWHAVLAALRSPAAGVKEIWLRRGREDRRSAELLQLARERQVPVRTVEAGVLDERAEGVSHQGVLALVMGGRTLDEADLERLLDGLDHPPFLLVLDGVRIRTTWGLACVVPTPPVWMPSSPPVTGRSG
jgi:23S rRNA (guanosine2251-2'-O)-methyltransferase